MDLLAKALEMRREGAAFAFATVIGCEGSTPRHLGAKMIVADSGAIFGTIGGGHLEAQVIERAFACIKSGEPARLSLALGPALGQCCGGKVEVFIEPDRAPDRLYLSGAGHIGAEKAAAALRIGFQVSVIDPRAEWNTPERFPAPLERLIEDGPEAIDHLAFDGRFTYCAVMTHDHAADEEIVRLLLAKPVRYLGLIGSKTKWARFRQRYAARGLAPEAIARVRCPIGLELQAETPAEIATSIAAELVKVRRARLAILGTQYLFPASERG